MTSDDDLLAYIVERLRAAARARSGAYIGHSLVVLLLAALDKKHIPSKEQKK